MSVEKDVIGPGRVETLTEEQELKLKQVWAHLLNFFGYKVVPAAAPKPLSRKTTAASSVVSNETTKKKRGLMGRFKLKHKKSKSIEKLEKVLSRHSTESGAAGADGVHPSLKELNSKDMYTAFWNFLRHDTPDNLLLRFVRARKWSVDDSLGMIAATMKWRCYEQHVDKVLRESELGCVENNKPGVIFQFDVGKCIIRGHDHQGRPIATVRAKLHHSSDQTFEEIQIYTILTIEYARLMLTEPVDTCDVIFNLEGMTMANMDYSAVSFMVKCFEAHYPESLGILFVHKAPWIFSGIWKIVRGWLDPVVASKIIFTNSTADLEKHINKDQIAKDLGGTDSFEYKYLKPTKEESGLAFHDDAKKASLEEERTQIIADFIQKTVDWIETADPASSKKLLEERISVGKKLAENYKKLDGFIRNRSIYDRLGEITFEAVKD